MRFIPPFSFWQTVDGSRQLFVTEKMGRYRNGEYYITDVRVADLIKHETYIMPAAELLAEINRGILIILK